MTVRNVLVADFDVQEEPDESAYAYKITIQSNAMWRKEDGPYLKLCIYRHVAGENLV